MSNINHRNPKAPHRPHHFGPLNHRREGETVGNTYGERRQQSTEKSGATGWVQNIKDFFGGVKTTKNIGDFSNPTDKYMGVQQANPIRHAQKKMEAGVKPASRVTGHIDYLTQLINNYPAGSKK